MPSHPTYNELSDRIAQATTYYGGRLTPQAGLVWDGYLAALLEWGLISVHDHERLTAMLPSVPDNPVVQLFLGWPQG